MGAVAWLAMGLGCVLLIVASAGLEIGGLILVAWDLWRVQQRELGMPSWMQTVQRVWARLRGRRDANVHATGGSATVSVRGGGATASGGRVRVATTLEERVANVEAALKDVDRATSERFATVEPRIVELRARADAARAEVEALRHELAEARKEELRESMPWQWRGIRLFALGALLGMSANLWC